MKTKQCSDCQETKAVSEFSLNGNDNPYPRCKPCRNAYVRKHKKKNSEPPEHEKQIVQNLIENGFPALHGRDVKPFNHVDIVVHGCVRIEAKLFKKWEDDLPNPGWYAGNSRRQQREGWLADVVCIMHEGELYFFEPHHPAFYIKGTLRSKILFNPNSLRKSRTTNRKLEQRDMDQARGNYDLIRYALRRWEIEHTKPKVVQIPLFPKAS